MLPPIRKARPPNIFFSLSPGSPSTRSRMRPASTSSYAMFGEYDAARTASARPGRVAADEPDEPVLRGRLSRYVDPRPELPAVAQHLLHGLHPGQGVGAALLAEVDLAAQRGGEVPGVHPHVGGVEAVDR